MVANWWACLEGIIGYLKAWNHKAETFENKLTIGNRVADVLYSIKNFLSRRIDEEQFRNKLLEAGVVSILAELLTEFFVTNGVKSKFEARSIIDLCLWIINTIPQDRKSVV